MRAMDRPYSSPLKRLRSVKLRPTRQRLTLAKLLFDSGENRHVTAESLHEETMRSDTRVSLATVYNALHQFTRAGLLREIIVESGKTYFDTNTCVHHHFFDAANGTLTDIDADEVQLVSVPATPDGVHIDRVEVIFQVKAT